MCGVLLYMETININEETINNDNFRKVLLTTSNIQVVAMSLNKDEKLDPEIHEVSDQFFRIEKGICKIKINNIEHILKDDDVIIIPKKTLHELTNLSDDKLKFYTIYSPPHHPIRTIDITKHDAQLREIELYRRKIDKYTSKLNEALKTLNF